MFYSLLYVSVLYMMHKSLDNYLHSLHFSGYLQLADLAYGRIGSNDISNFRTVTISASYRHGRPASYRYHRIQQAHRLVDPVYTLVPIEILHERLHFFPVCQHPFPKYGTSVQNLQALDLGLGCAIGPLQFQILLKCYK